MKKRYESRGQSGARAVQMTRSGVKGQVARCDHDFVIANPA